jgi:2,3-bisphosphoglycerate-dependent phosphoglycerate mutase
MSLLVLLRHGQSIYNSENRFTGDLDVALTPLGEQEARSAGDKLIGFDFSVAYTSILARAKRTLHLVLEQISQSDIPVAESAALNERCYGSLQGLNKKDVEDSYGVSQVETWRRSYWGTPPGGESLETVVKRVAPYYISAIVPNLAMEKNVLVVAHGNSLRALIMYLEEMDDAEIAKVNIATGVPRVYTLTPEAKIFHVYDLESTLPDKSV